VEWLLLIGLCVAAPQPHALRDPLHVPTPLRDPFDATAVPVHELRDPFATHGELKELPPPPLSHAVLRVPDELR